MFKRLLVVGFILVVAVRGVVVAEEAAFRFSNWPLADFSSREILNPFSGSHFGVDIAADEGEEVKAVADGTVYWTYSSGSHGISVGVEHPNGFRTTYLHLSERLVKKGQEVKASDLIGRVGTTGSGRDAAEPHLHFALIIDPSADVSNYSQRYGDPLAYGPVEQKPAEESVEQPAVQEQPVAIIADEAPGLVSEAINEPVAQLQVSPEPAIKKAGQLADKSLEPGKNIHYLKEKESRRREENTRRIIPIETKPINESAKLLREALKPKPHLPKVEKGAARKPNLNSQVEPSKAGNRGIILLYWLGLAAVGYLYYLVNRKKTNKLGFTC